MTKSPRLPRPSDASFDELCDALNMLALPPPMFAAIDMQESQESDTTVALSRIDARYLEQRALHWLTRLLAANLSHLSEQELDQVMSLASTRLVERCGRQATPEMHRDFSVVYDEPGGKSDRRQAVIRLREPAVTYETLGFKTWGAAFHLANNLAHLGLVPAEESGPKVRAIELGAGTGLAGLSISALLDWHVVLTDMEAIVGNLTYNVTQNALKKASARVLDWTMSVEEIVRSFPQQDYIIVCDCIYEESHPAMLVPIVRALLRKGGAVITCHPERETHSVEQARFRDLLYASGLRVQTTVAGRGWEDWNSLVTYATSLWREAKIIVD